MGPGKADGDQHEFGLNGEFGARKGLALFIHPGAAHAGDAAVFADDGKGGAGELALNAFGNLYRTNRGMELRGTRPIKDDPDAMLRITQDTWYGFPDYSTDLVPITDPRFQLTGDMRHLNDRTMRVLLNEFRRRIQAEQGLVVDPPILPHWHQVPLVRALGEELDLPVIDGLAAAPRDGAALVDEPRAALAARLLAELEPRPDLAGRVSQIDVSDVRDAVVLLKDDTAFLRLGDEQFTDRLQSYIDLAPALRERVDGIDTVDLRFDERIYVRPHARGDRPWRRRGGGN